MFKHLLITALALGAITSGLCAELKQGRITNVTRLTRDLDVKYANPQWSPDGNTLAFTHLGYDNLFIINRDGTDMRKISGRSQVGYMYQWSADSKEILVRDTRWEQMPDSSQMRAHAVWTVSIDGTNTRVSDDAPYMQPAAWRYNTNGAKHIALDGKILETKSPALTAKARARMKTTPEKLNISFITDFDNLYVVGADGTKTSILEGPAFFPQLSPDGTRVLFVNMADEICTINLDGTGLKVIAKGFNPSWVNDRQVVFDRTKDNGHVYTAGELVLARVDTDAEIVLTSTPDKIEMNPVVSPDGKKIAFTDFADGQLYVADIE